ncbi:MAG: DMT family transporter [Clostridia bacterium]|nr:DMT family transporter [Clostridia bacterium]
MIKNENTKKNIAKGIILIVLSSLFFAIMTTFVKCSGDLPSIQKSFFRNAVSFFFALAFVLKSKSGFFVSKSTFKDLFFRSFFGTLGVVFYFYSVDHLVLSDSTALNKMSPFFAIFFSYILLKEKVTRFQTLAVLGAFAGSMFVVKPSFSNVDLLPAVIGLLGGIFAGIAYTMVRKLSESGVNSSFIVLFFSAFSCISLLPIVVLDYHAMTWTQVGLLLLAGLFAGAGQFAITSAYFYAAAKDISLYSYSQIIFSSILSLLFFGEWPDHWSIIGYIIIFAMAALVYFSKAKGWFEKQDIS